MEGEGWGGFMEWGGGSKFLSCKNLKNKQENSLKIKIKNLTKKVVGPGFEIWGEKLRKVFGVWIFPKTFFSRN